MDVPAGDVTIHMWVTGGDPSSPAFVLVNGGPGLTHHYMAPLADLASSSHRVVLYDQRGMGRSTAPANLDSGVPNYTGDAYVADLEAVRVALGVDRMHLLGHSNGGWITQAYLLAHAERVASMVLVDSLPPSLDEQIAGWGRFYAHVSELQTQGVLPATFPSDGCERTRALTPAYFADPTMAIPEPLAQTECSNDPPTHDRASSQPYDWSVALRAIQLPVLIVFGSEDAFGTEWAVAESQALGAAGPILLSGAGHFPWFENPMSFNEALRGFLASNVHR